MRACLVFIVIQKPNSNKVFLSYLILILKPSLFILHKIGLYGIYIDIVLCDCVALYCWTTVSQLTSLQLPRQNQLLKIRLHIYSYNCTRFIGEIFESSSL